MDWPAFAALAAVTFLGAMVQSAFGFGFAILAAPLFLVVMASTAAVPVLAVLNLAVSAVVVVGLWRKAPGRLLGLLCLGSAAGFPLGLALFARTDLEQMKVVVGFVIMSFALLLIARERGLLPLEQRPAPDPGGDGVTRAGVTVPFGVGFVSGVMAAALAMPGPVAMLYLTTLQLDKERSRALSLALFTFSYASVSVLHAWAGSLDRAGLLIGAALLAFVGLGALAGHWLAARVSEAAFRQWVLVILFLAGFYAVLSAS